MGGRRPATAGCVGGLARRYRSRPMPRPTAVRIPAQRRRHRPAARSHETHRLPHIGEPNRVSRRLIRGQRSAVARLRGAVETAWWPPHVSLRGRCRHAVRPRRGPRCARQVRERLTPLADAAHAKAVTPRPTKALPAGEATEATVSETPRKRVPLWDSSALRIRRWSVRSARPSSMRSVD